MKKFIYVLMSSTLVMSTLAFAAPNQKVSASELNYVSDNFEIITDTEEKSEYILKVDGQEIHYIETVTTIDEDTKEIETKAYNEETNELLQHFTSVVKEDKIVDQDVISFEELPQSQQEDSTIVNNGGIALFASVTSNKSLITYLGIKYSTNHTTNIGSADYAGLKTKKVNLTTASAKNRQAYNSYTQNVDSL
ncbi:hypothetical protein, partial [Streptomyces sp. NPDC001732]